MKSLSFLLTATLLSISSSAFSEPRSENDPNLTEAKRILKNFGQVTPYAFRGSAPGLNGNAYQALKAIGVQHVISLEGWLRDMSPLCDHFSLNCVRFPVDVSSPFTVFKRKFKTEAIQEAFTYILNAKARGEKVYFHCLLGSDRTGVLASALTIREEACAFRNYDRGSLKSKIIEAYDTYGRNWIFPKNVEESLEWAEEPPEWICAS